MKAKEYYKIYMATMKAPTDRKKVNLARKLGLLDTYDNVVWYTGLPHDKAKEFTKEV